MIRIAVVDDDNDALMEVENYLYRYFTDSDVKLLLYKYIDGKDLLESDEKYDLIFLDIEMKFSNGIEVAEIIRKHNNRVPIVYITSYTDYWRRAFKVHAFGFITKPFNEKDFSQVLDDYFMTFCNSDLDVITLTTNEGPICFNYDEILYFFFKTKRNVSLFTKEKEYIIRENLSAVYEKLDKRRFYQPRRECIINLRNVKRLQNDYAIVMVDGSVLPLAQRRKEEFMKRLADAFTDVVKG